MIKKSPTTKQQDIISSLLLLIKQVKTLKVDSMFKAEKGTKIKYSIDAFIEAHWPIYHTEALMNESFDFSVINKLHQHLIVEVMDIIKNEQSIANQILIENNIDVKQILPQAEDSKLAHGVYMFSKNDLDIEYIVIGDVHSDDQSVVKLLDATDFYHKVATDVKIKLIFMGDYVDRGKAHLKTLERILLLKILFPENIYLLRGNHDGGKFQEDGTIKLPYRIPDQDQLVDYFPKYLEQIINDGRGIEIKLLEDYFMLFDHLPYIAFIWTESGVVQCVHGGLPKPFFGRDHLDFTQPYDFIETLSMLTCYPELDNAGATILENLMWSDPYNGGEDYKMAYKRFKFTHEHFNAYAEKIGIWKMLRGHEARAEGFEINHQGLVYTIFSSGDTLDSHYNGVDACYAHVKQSGDIVIHHFIESI